jgi:tetratricopeptide (TPR) repeat protein
VTRSPIATAPARALLALALASACAGPRPRPGGEAGREEVRFSEPQLVEVTALDRELAGKNDEELFAIGTAAYGAGEFRRAAAAFDRLADLHPSSRHHAAALYDAGLAHQRLGEWRLALERFRALEKGYEGPDAVEASFRVAECLYHLGELVEARAALTRLSGRSGLPAAERVRALAQLGVVELELGDADAAERSLRQAIGAFGQAREVERLDDRDLALAQFHLGEVYRARFLAVRLDPSAAGEEKLAPELELKAGLLLSAQGHYLRTIRIGNSAWAVAAGSRIGELYDGLHAELVAAPLPPGLDEEQQHAYRAELRGRVRVLVTKAIAIYEQTLATARRTGVDNPFVEKTEASLERMRRALLDGGAAAAPPAEPAVPREADPAAPVAPAPERAGGAAK